MKSPLDDSLRNALAGMTGGPAPLSAAIKFYAQQARGDAEGIENALAKRVSAGANDEVRKLFNSCLGQWDWEENAPWTAASEANTRNRRSRIYELMRIGSRLRAALDLHVPPYEGAKAIVIEDPKALRDWYTFEFRKRHNFYWSKLRDFLGTARSIDPDGVNSIESSANRIVERLADPALPETYKARGLVVGYVQSGKTTNFTAVIAKAIDAGYRLIIVLSGTTNLLRNQTQRRLDMELVGRENILRGGSEEEAQHDYSEDQAWPAKFISYGAQPGRVGSVDVHRLTGQEDFASKDAGLNPLDFEFEKRDKRRPLYDRENLDHAGSRIAVVKKQEDRLKALVNELKAVGREKCAEVPTIIIDDESDQASVNTVDPKKPKKDDDRVRSQINNRVVEILRLLPRAQYLGYTATPFANVFVNPNDPEDIYPKDFIISLQRPAGYMGASEFLDLEVPQAGRLSNMETHIRDIPDRALPNEDRLVEAVDAFVLTGALKKYREKRNHIEFKHHTMLFHHSVKKGDQADVVKWIRKLWKKAGYDSPGDASTRLERLLEQDYRKVWAGRGQSKGLHFPKGFAELKPFIGAALDEIQRGSSPVLMVNSAEGADVPDFDGKGGVWKIIVGGAKLSRGYTIEGLTISFFRRPAKMQDTLMQMGRWFGYRPGYADLVRLYIGRAEPDGKKTIDLYRAFEAMCRDEEDFRAQLAMYEGKGGITPKEVPALVFNSYPRLRPTSRNKMFNAKITWAAFDYREPTSQSAGAGRKENAALFEKLVSKLRIKAAKVNVVGSKSSFDIKWGLVSGSDMLSVLSKISWEKTGDPIKAEIEFLRQKNAPIDSWVFLAPQIASGEAGSWDAGAEQFACVARTRVEPSRFGVYSSPDHLSFAKWLVGSGDQQYVSSLQPRPRTAVLLFYPTREILTQSPRKVAAGIPVMGFGLVLPKAAGALQRIAYSV